MLKNIWKSLKKHTTLDTIIFINFSAYLKKNEGKICKDYGLWDIISEGSCKEASVTHNLTWGGVIDDEFSPSCLVEVSNNFTFFNQNERAWNTFVDEKYAPICEGILR